MAGHRLPHQRPMHVSCLSHPPGSHNLPCLLIMCDYAQWKGIRSPPEGLEPVWEHGFLLPLLNPEQCLRHSTPHDLYRNPHHATARHRLRSRARNRCSGQDRLRRCPRSGSDGCGALNLPVTRPIRPVRTTLADFLDHPRELVDMRKAEKLRLHSTGHDDIAEQIDTMISLLATLIAADQWINTVAPNNALAR